MMRRTWVMTCLLVAILQPLCWAGAGGATRLLATFDDGQLTLKDFAAYHPELVSWFGLGVKTSEVRIVVEDVIFGQLLAREARHHGFAEQPQLRMQIDRILATAYLQSRMPEAPLAISEAEMRRYYDAHQDQFLLPPRMRLSHILVRSEHEARTIQQAVQQGQPFRELAAERSLDPASAQHGGQLGWVYPEQLTPPLAQAARALQPGHMMVNQMRMWEMAPGDGRRRLMG